MKRVDRYIPLAVNVIEDFILDEHNIVAPEWDNCVCNFGAAIRQMGFFTAVTAFSQETEGSEVSKKAMLHYLLRIIRNAEGRTCETDEPLEPIVKEHPDDIMLRRQVTDAAIALKIALRLFIENPKDEEDANHDITK